MNKRLKVVEKEIKFIRTNDLKHLSMRLGRVEGEIIIIGAMIVAVIVKAFF